MRKLFLLISVVFFLLLSPAIPISPMRNNVYAGNYVDNGFAAGIQAALFNNDINAEGHIASVVSNMMSDTIRRTVGPVMGITTNSTDAVQIRQMQKDSLVYGVNSMITYVYTNPPASTYAFIRDTGESLGFFPKTAYAQGVGFSGLTALLPIWKVFRNIAYLLLAIFMIVIGFFIMFRKKIDPKTVVSVQNALPNIVITLLLITFSYAIVGLLIDFMYLIIMLSISILKPISNGAITDDVLNTFVSGNFYTPMRVLFSSGLNETLNAFLGFFNLTLPQPSTTSSLGTDNLGILGYLISGGSAGGLVLFLPTLIVIFLYCCAWVFAVIRLFIVLVKAYIQIIMSLLISPFQLLLGAFPGSHAFEGWIKNLIVNIAVFPITAIMLIIGSIIIKYSSAGTTKLWGPPMLNSSGSEGMLGIIGIGVLFAIPSVIASLKEAMKTKSPVGMGIGGAVGFATTAGEKLFQYRMQQDYYNKSLKYASEKSGATDRARKDQEKAIDAIK